MYVPMASTISAMTPAAVRTFSFMTTELLDGTACDGTPVTRPSVNIDLMKAMLLKAPNAPLVLENVADPVPGRGEAVARVLACGAGLTVHHARAGRLKIDYPRILGHEIAAEIVAVGEGVTAVKPGDGVTAYFYLTCGECR